MFFFKSKKPDEIKKIEPIEQKSDGFFKTLARKSAIEAEDKKQNNINQFFQLIEPYQRPGLKLDLEIKIAMDSGEPYPSLCDPPDMTNMINMLDPMIMENVNSFFADGLGFRGYSALSMMSQRPEYRKMVETYAKEATREWIVIKASGKGKDQRIKELEDEFKRLKVKEAFFKASEHDGFFGLAHIILDFGDPIFQRAFPKLPDPKFIPKGSLKRLINIEPIWTSPNDYNAYDPLDPHFYKPKNWLVYNHLVDSSRILTMVSREVPDILKPSFNFGGVALTQLAKPYVDNWLNTRSNIARMIETFSIVNLQTNLSQQAGNCDFTRINDVDAGGLINRIQAFNQLRGNMGTLVTDKNTEDLQILNASLGSLDRLQAQSQEQMASVTGQPLIKMFGIQPTGLNASSEEEMRVWYDEISSYQEYFYKPALDKLLKIIQISLWGEADDEIYYEFLPLWQLDEQQRATINLTKAQAAEIYLGNGVTSPDEERKRMMQDDNSGYNGVDLSGEAPSLFDDDDDETQEPQNPAEKR